MEHGMKTEELKKIRKKQRIIKRHFTNYNNLLEHTIKLDSKIEELEEKLVKTIENAKDWYFIIGLIFFFLGITITIMMMI